MCSPTAPNSLWSACMAALQTGIPSLAKSFNGLHIGNTLLNPLQLNTVCIPPTSGKCGAKEPAILTT